jgi:soluble lytic murein transglycosylase
MLVTVQTFAKIIYWNIVAGLLVVGLAGGSLLRRHHEVDTLILEQSRARGLDPLLVAAVVGRESNFDPAALSESGAAGLMQITEPAGKSWAQATGRAAFDRYDLFNPAVNLEAGTWILSEALRRWSAQEDPLPYALADYRAGRANAQRWADAARASGSAFLDAVTYPTVQQYVQDVLKRYRG